MPAPKKTPRAGSKKLVLYGKDFSKHGFNNQFEVELFCLNWSLRGKPAVGLGPYEHFRNVQQILWPDRVWHDWSEKRLRAFCRYKTNVWAGCASSAKTTDSALIAMEYFLAAPEETIVVLTSTTGKMVRKRIWPEINRLYHSMCKQVGEEIYNMVDSKTMLQARRGDDKHGIFAMAVKEGNSSKAAADIQGMHAPRMLLIIDEATDTPEAIFEVIHNLRMACEDFRLIVIGNPNSYLDPHGMCAEPRAGWPSVSIEDDEWETAGVPKWRIDPGVCLRFDAVKSPNIIAGRKLYHFLPSEDDIDLKSKDTPQFWKYSRGFWAPEGICRTVLSDAMIIKHDGMGQHTFKSWKKPCAFLDPAFGGDKCKFKLGTYGDVMDGRVGLQLGKGVAVPISALSKEPIHYQIANYVISECEREGINPEDFAMDTTGEGGGTADIICKEWGRKLGKQVSIVRVEFGGKASEMPVSEEDNRLACDAYDRKVTELYFSAREYLIAGLLKGLDREECVQFKSREYDDEKRRIRLDTKAECKEKIGHSPDDADAVVVGIELMRRKGYVSESVNKPASKEGEKELKAQDALIEGADYSESTVDDISYA